MATVRKLRGKYYLDYRDAHGRRHRERAGDGLSVRRAERLLREKLVAIDRGGGGASREAFGAYARRWLERRRLSVKPGTADDYEDKLELYVLAEKIGLADVELRRVTKPLLEEWMLALRRRFPKRSPSTLNAALTVAGMVLESAVADGLVDVNAARHVARLPRAEARVDWLTPAELGKLFRAAEQVDAELGLMVRVALLTGIRRGELLALRWSDVDLARGLLLIRRSYRAGVFSAPKSRRSRRPVELGPDLAGRLAARRGSAPAEALVFPGEDGGPLEPSLVSGRRWRRVLKAAGLRESLRWHDLRHTLATLMLAQGESVRLVQEQLGHASAALTLDVYAHVGEGGRRGAVERLEAVLAGSAPDAADRAALEGAEDRGATGRAAGEQAPARRRGRASSLQKQEARGPARRQAKDEDEGDRAGQEAEEEPAEG